MERTGLADTTVTSTWTFAKRLGSHGDVAEGTSCPRGMRSSNNFGQAAVSRHLMTGLRCAIAGVTIAVVARPKLAVGQHCRRFTTNSRCGRHDCRIVRAARRCSLISGMVARPWHWPPPLIRGTWARPAGSSIEKLRRLRSSVKGPIDRSGSSTSFRAADLHFRYALNFRRIAVSQQMTFRATSGIATAVPAVKYRSALLPPMLPVSSD